MLKSVVKGWKFVCFVHLIFLIDRFYAPFMEVNEIQQKHKFFARGHWWFDSGIMGFYFIADAFIRRKNLTEVRVTLEPDGLIIETSEERLKSFVEACYEDLATRWWNVSTEKQEESLELVLYDRQRNELILAPKRMPTPIAALSVSGSSWRGEAENFENLDSMMRDKVEAFLQEKKKKLWGAKEKLLYEQPVCHPQIDVFPKKGKKRTCSVCGQLAACTNVSQTSFPLFSSQNATFSFNSELSSPDIICWECDLLGKFAVHAAGFKVVSPYTYILQLNANDINVMESGHKTLGCASTLYSLEESIRYFSNFEKSHFILCNARLSYEILWGFYIAAYDVLLENQIAKKIAHKEQNEEDLADEALEQVASLNVILMALEDKGQTFITKEVINYTDSTYIFRLIEYVRRSSRDSFPNASHKFWDNLFFDLLLPNPQKPFDPINGLYRNRILQRIFKKNSVLQEIEKFVFAKSLKTDYPNLRRILFFTTLYEQIINRRDIQNEEGSGMTKGQVEIAKNLGFGIVLEAIRILTGKSAYGQKQKREENTDEANKAADWTLSEKERERIKPIKGNLFALRKTRTTGDFLEQLNRLQFRYGVSISKEIGGGILEDENVSFDDFKSYCMISALNAFNSAMRPGVSQDKDINQEKEQLA